MISQLFSKKESFENKTVKIKGQVTKVNLGIMNKNWIHIQDGTTFGDNTENVSEVNITAPPI